jgi:arylsulfatase A-like enzyme
MIRFTTLLVCLAVYTATCDAADQPNVVLILADDVGCEPLGCYGGTSHQTPNIDDLAQRGMRFDHCYSMPVCHPTRVCLLTGRYPMNIGNPQWGSFPKTLEEQTIAQVMKAAGYATAVDGKWQLAMLGTDLQQPHRMGFDEYCLFGWHEGPRYHDPLIWQNGTRRTGTKGRYGQICTSTFRLISCPRIATNHFFSIRWHDGRAVSFDYRHQSRRSHQRTMETSHTRVGLVDRPQVVRPADRSQIQLSNKISRRLLLQVILPENHVSVPF